MTLVIRSSDSLSAPPQGSKVIPPLSMAGAIHRWHADTFTAASGASLSSLPDLVGGLDLAPVGTVTAVLDDATQRAVSLTGSGYFGSAVNITPPDQFTIAARVYLAENPGSVCWMIIAGGPTGTTPSLAAQSSMFRAYGGTTTNHVSTATTTKPGWFTLVATYDRTNQLGKIAVNGGTPVSGAQSWGGSVTGLMRLTGSGVASGVKFRQVVVLDGIASDVQMANLAADLGA